MMADTTQVHQQALVEAIKGCSAEVSEVQPGRWEFCLVNGRTLPVSAAVSDGWVLLDAEVASVALDDEKVGQTFWRLLQVNGALPQAVKFALDHHSHSVHLRTEIPLDRPTSLAKPIRRACAGFATGLKRFHDPGAPRRKPGTAPAADQNNTEWKEWCAAGKWQYSERPSGELNVQLDTPAAVSYALVTRRKHGGVAIACEIARFKSLSQRSRLAIAVLLLGGCAAVRMARAAVDSDPDEPAARLEVTLSGGSHADRFVHALSSLSVACRLCGQREVSALRNDTVATHYLRARGWSLKPTGVSALSARKEVSHGNLANHLAASS